MSGLTVYRSRVTLTFPPGLWNFFSGQSPIPNLISNKINRTNNPGKTKLTDSCPDDLDTTSLALTALNYDPALAHPILDKMLTYVDQDGCIQTYTDRSRPRPDAVISLNVLVAFHKYARGYQLPQTMDWVHRILLHRAYLHGTRY